MAKFIPPGQIEISGWVETESPERSSAPFYLFLMLSDEQKAMGKQELADLLADKVRAAIEEVVK